MYQKKNTYLVILYFLSFTIKAQQILFPSHHQLVFGYRNPITANQFMMLSHSSNLQKQPAAFSSGSINDLPFFCAMECKVRKHTNIWIKLRAGDDANYMKMIKGTER